MTDQVESPPPAKFQSYIADILKRPIEFGLIGSAIVLVMYLASQADILPKVFKGAGFELEFQETQERVVQAVVGTAGGVEDLKQQVAELQNEIQDLKETVSDLTGEGPRLPSATARIAPVQNKQDVAAPTEILIDVNQSITGNGVIWIGTWDSKIKKWTDSTVDAAQLPMPQDLVGFEGRLSKDVNVRENFPARDDSYYTGIKALGVAANGGLIQIQTRPQAFERSSGTQIWAEVTTTYRPYIGSK